MPGSAKCSQVFAILFTEPAGNNAINSVTDYNSALSMVQYGEWAHTQVRRFIVARRKREHCYSVWVHVSFIQRIYLLIV
jgi:hypothetical protein